MWASLALKDKTMKQSVLLTIVLCVAVGIAETRAPAVPLDLKGKTLAQTFEELLPGMGAADPAARREPQQEWQKICFQAGAPGNEAAREEACKLMSGKLDAGMPQPARIWLLKQLERIGRGECVDQVAALLDDKDELVRDAAVRCLANNPAAGAGAKLLARLPAADGKAKIGLINALGYRSDPDAVEALAKELAAKDAAVATAAARALGKIATPQAAKELSAARTQAQGQVLHWVCDSYLLCADRRLKEGKTAAAADIYEELYKAGASRPVRLAALRGVLQSTGDRAGGLLLEILGGADGDARAVALGQIETLPAGGLKVVSAGLEKLPAARQAQVLGALAARGDKSLLPAALRAVKAQDESVQRAGVLALGRLGDASVVPLLLEMLFADSKLSGPARESLALVIGAGVDDALVAALQAEKDTGRRGTLISVLEGRRSAAPVAALLKDVLSDDPMLRSSALSALKQLAEPKHVPEMLKALLKAEKGRERVEAEGVIAAVCNQISEPEKRAEPVLAAFTAGSKADRLVLLPLLGQVGGTRARETITNALAGDDAELRQAGANALCNWPDASVSEELLALARNAKDPGQRLQVLQALTRVHALPGGRSPAEKLALFKKAMELATRAEERAQVLAGLASARDLETLRFVLPYLDDKDLVEPACKTVVELAHHKNLREPNKAEFDKALDKVIAVCQDPALVDRAKQYRR